MFSLYVSDSSVCMSGLLPQTSVFILLLVILSLTERLLPGEPPQEREEVAGGPPSASSAPVEAGVPEPVVNTAEHV